MSAFASYHPETAIPLSAHIGRWAARCEGPRRAKPVLVIKGPGEVKKYAPFAPRERDRPHVGGRRLGRFSPVQPLPSAPRPSWTTPRRREARRRPKRARRA